MQVLYCQKAESKFGNWFLLETYVVTQCHNHILFFDNFFSDVNRSGPQSTWTESRGDTKSELVEGNTIQCLVWQDKMLVSLVNTAYDPLAIKTVNQKNKDGSICVVTCPESVKAYNTFMGGVDLADAKRKTYSCSRRSKKKWWHRLFYFVIHIAIVNALMLETPNVETLSQKDFRAQRQPNLCHFTHQGGSEGPFLLMSHFDLLNSIFWTILADLCSVVFVASLGNASVHPMVAKTAIPMILYRSVLSHAIAFTILGARV